MAGMTLLIVDDDAPLRGRLARVMQRQGFTVVDAEVWLRRAP